MDRCEGVRGDISVANRPTELSSSRVSVEAGKDLEPRDVQGCRCALQRTIVALLKRPSEPSFGAMSLGLVGVALLQGRQERLGGVDYLLRQSKGVAGELG